MEGVSDQFKVVPLLLFVAPVAAETIYCNVSPQSL